MSPYHPLRMYKFSIGPYNPEFVLINTDSQGMMGTRVDEIDPDPFFPWISLNDFQFRVCLGAVFGVGVFMARD